EQAIGEVRVVLEDAGLRRAAVLPGAPESAVRRPKGREQRVRSDDRRSAVGLAVRPGYAARVRQRRDRQPVPGGQRLVVTRGLRPPSADIKEPFAGGTKPLLRSRIPALGD